MTGARPEVLTGEVGNQAFALPGLLVSSPGGNGAALSLGRWEGLGAMWDGRGLAQGMGPWPVEGRPLLSRGLQTSPFPAEAGLGSESYHLGGPKLALNANQEGNYNNVRPTCLLFLAPQ